MRHETPAAFCIQKAHAPTAVAGSPIAGGRSRRRDRRSRTAALVALLVGALGLGATSAAPASAACQNAAFRGGPSAHLPDCRAFEQVSPADKGGHPGVTPDFLVQATSNGEAVAYLSYLSGFANARSASFPDAYVSRRGATGWTTTNVSPPSPDLTPPGAFEVSYAFSEDLSLLVTQLPLERLAAGAPSGVGNLFLSATTGAGGYSWINSVVPPHLPPEGCPPFVLELCFEFPQNLVAFSGASADFHHVLFESTQSLVEGAPETFPGNLYESTFEGGEWKVSLAGILPDGTMPIGGSEPGNCGICIFYKNHDPVEVGRVANSISRDGRRVVFAATADGGAPDPAQNELPEVYDRIDGTETVELSAPASGAEPKNTTPRPAQFWAASADGTRVFFTSVAELTTNSYTGAPVCEEGAETGCSDRGDLYEYDLETNTLKDLTIDTNLPADAEEGAAVQGVVGTSADGSYVYFVAKGQLVPGKGTDHADNLYMVHEGGTPVFIATLSESDGRDWAEKPTELESYVTPDGRHLAFTSISSLETSNFPGGYDNVNERTGRAEREVYEYSAPAEGAGSLACVSCNPSEAPPIGPGLLGSVVRPGAEGFSDSSPFQAVRVVSDNGGRVFFSSQDALTSAASVNTLAKVYEYEQDGEGSCETASGCVYLLSSPTGPQAASFLEADGEGNNVFLATVSKLTASDEDQLRDVYDARVGGGIPGPPVEVPCRSNCRTPSAGSQLETEPLTGVTGASGNLAPPSGSASKANTQKLAKALKACRKKRNKHRRRRCEARARKAHGAATEARKSGHRGKRRGR